MLLFILKKMPQLNIRTYMRPFYCAVFRNMAFVIQLLKGTNRMISVRKLATMTYVLKCATLARIFHMLLLHKQVSLKVSMLSSNKSKSYFCCNNYLSAETLLPKLTPTGPPRFHLKHDPQRQENFPAAYYNISGTKPHNLDGPVGLVWKVQNASVTSYYPFVSFNSKVIFQWEITDCVQTIWMHK